MPGERQSPFESATEFPVGSIARGNDDQLWVITTTSTGVQRWTPYTSAKLNGFKVLTVDYLAKNIGKPVKLYERSSSAVWPKSTKERDMYSYTFIPSGDVRPLNRKTAIKNWLKDRTPSIKKGQLFLIEGQGFDVPGLKDGEYWLLSIDPNTSEIVTSNLRNTQTFIRV